MRKFKKILNDNEHPFWILLQQLVNRILVGVKFLLLARLLGPESIGLISIALVSLAIIESLTQLGIMETIIQRNKQLGARETNAVWSIQFSRGVIIGLAMFLLTPLIVKLFGNPEAKNLVYLISLVPVITNSVSIEIFKNIRARNFKPVSVIEFLTIFIDMCLSISLVVFFDSPIGVIIAQIISQIFKVVSSHVYFQSWPKITYDKSLIKEINKYGKWIWGNSIASLVLNQFDKVLASKFLGTMSLGYYQMSQKFSQMSITDVSFALGQYHFPLFSKLKRDSNENMSSIFFNFYSLVFNLSTLTAIYIYTNGKFLIYLVLGSKWLDMIGLLNIMIISACLAATMNVSVVFLRSIGKPNIVTITSYIQLAMYVPISFLGVLYFEEKGLVIATIISLILSNVILTTFSLKHISSLRIRISTVFKVIIFTFAVLLSSYINQITDHTNNIVIITTTILYIWLVLMQLKRLIIPINYVKSQHS